MIVSSFAIKYVRDYSVKLALLDDLNERLLNRDLIWHFFLDPSGITLRVNPDFEKETIQALKELKREGYHFTFKKAGNFNPAKHEYQFVRFVGDEMQLIFHATSLMALKYPRHVFKYPILERINHIVINQTGQHDFLKEADDYIDAAYQRASLQGKVISIPKWLHKLYFRLRRLV